MGWDDAYNCRGTAPFDGFDRLTAGKLRDRAVVPTVGYYACLRSDPGLEKFAANTCRTGIPFLFAYSGKNFESVAAQAVDPWDIAPALRRAIGGKSETAGHYGKNCAGKSRYAGFGFAQGNRDLGNFTRR